MAQTRTRMLIGAGSFADARSALRIASRLTREIIADLGGLLIEDADVMAAYTLPNQRVISPSGSVIMLPSQDRIRTLMKADAAAFRKLLADVADPPSADWTFEQQVGDLIECAIRVGQGWDVLIVGHRDVHPLRGKVLFLGAPATQQDGALTLATTLARQLDTRLEIFSIGQGDAHWPQAPVVAFETLDAALSQLTRANVQAVVVDLARGPIRNHDQLRALLDVARCPVIIMGASEVDPKLEHSTQIPPAPGPG